MTLDEFNSLCPGCLVVRRMNHYSTYVKKEDICIVIGSSTIFSSFTDVLLKHTFVLVKLGEQCHTHDIYLYRSFCEKWDIVKREET